MTEKTQLFQFAGERPAEKTEAEKKKKWYQDRPDPGERRNLFGDSRYADRLAEMRKAMVCHLQERGTDFVKDGKLVVRDQTLLYSPNYPKD